MADMQVGIKVTADSGQAKGEITQLSGDLSKLGNTANAALSKANNSFGKTRQGIESISTQLGHARVAFEAMATAFALKNFAAAFIDAAREIERMNGMLEAASGSAVLASRDLAYIKDTANTLGAEVLSTANSFAKLTAASKGTSLQGQSTRDIFSSVSKAAASLGLSAAESEGALLAISQMMSKGKVSAEELRGQLGERLPGAFNAAARAMGMTTAEFSKLLDSGQIMAETFLPKLAKELDQTFGNARFDRIGNNINRLSNAWLEFKDNLSNTSAINAGIDLLTKTLNGWNSLLKTPSLEERINQEIKTINELEGSTKRYQYLYREETEKSIAAHKKMLELLIAQQKIEKTRVADAATPAITKSAEEAALALTKLTDKQKAVAQIVIDTAKAYKVDPAFALAIAEQESGFNQLAVSGKKAQGVMQLMPNTAKQLGVDFSDLNDNIKGGVLYLSQQEKQFKSLRLAAAAYNAGPGAVQKYGGVPPYKETQNYVTSVGALYQKWQQVLGAQGEAFVSAKDQADELSNAFKQVQTHQDDNIKKADEYARVQVEKIKTQLAAMDQEREAAARLTAEQLAGAKTYEDKAKIIEAAQAKAAEYNAQALEMVRAEYDAQQQSLEAKKQAYQAELAQADKYNVSIDDQFKLKQAIRAADNDLLLLAENRAQAEITAAGKVNEFAKQSADLKRNEVTAIDGIIAAYQRQADILDRLTAAKQAGANADQLALLNDVYQSTGNLPELVSPDQIERMQQYILSTQALKGAVDELTGSQKKNQEQAVREEQLRMNAYWDQTIGRLREYAAIMKEITGKDNNPWSDMAIGAMEYAKNVDQITAKYDDLQKEWRKSTGAADDQTDTYLSMQAALEQGQAAASLMAKTMLVARENTEKGSKAYDNLTTAAENFMAITQLLNVAEGIAAILNQYKGDPYTAAFRAAAVAMQVASMGINTGFSGGGSGLSGKDNINRTGTGGGVFGGKADEVSNSIADSLEIIKQNSSSDLNYSAAMLRSLQNIESSLAGVSNQVIRGVGPDMSKQLGTLQNGADIFAFGMDTSFDPLASAIFNLVYNKSRKIIGYGIQGLDQSLNDILKSGFQGLNFTDYETTVKSFGMTVSKKLEATYKELSSPLERQLTLVFVGIADALKAGAEAFGLTGDQVMDRIGKTSLNLGKLDLAGLSGEEVQKKLAEAFSSMTDTLAKRLLPGLKDFIQVGEGYAKTFFRVADGINQATVELAQLAVKGVQYRQINNKQGNVGVEIVFESLIAQNKLTDNLKKFLKDLKTTADSAADLADSYRKMIQANNLMTTAGVGGLSQTMTNAAGGLDAFISSMQTFNDEFLSVGMAGEIRGLAEQFAALGYSLPTSRDDFAKMVQAINTTDEAGQQLFGQMIALADSFAQVSNEIDRLKDKYASILDPLYAIRKQIEEVGSDFSTLLGNATATIEAKYGSKRQAEQADIAMLQPGYTAAMETVSTLPKQIDAWLKEMQTAKPARKKKLQQMISDARTDLAHAQEAVNVYGAWIQAAKDEITKIDMSEATDKMAAKAPILAQARDAMAMTLESIFNDLAQTIQQAQQRLQSVLDLQKSIASQIAQLQGPQAVFGLASTDRNNAFGAIDTYINSLSDGRARDVGVEVGLLNTAQQAVMAKYNAEVAAIQEAQQAYIAAETEKLNAALQLQIDAINAATEAAIEAENDRLNAAIKVQQKIDEAAIKSKQKEFDAANKLAQKAFDEEQKALQKIHDEKLQALQDELDAANKLNDAIKSIAEYAAGLALSQNATLSPEARLAEARRQYQTLVSAAQGGDVEAMGKLAGASDAYLEAAKTYYGSSTNYQDIFDGVQKAMTAIGGMSAPDPDSIQSRIDQLREAQATEMEALRELQAEKLDAIREIQAEQLDAIREQQQAGLDAMREASQKTTDAIREAAQSQIEALQKQTQQAIADLSDPTKNRAMADAKAAAERDMKRLADLAELTRKEAEIQAQQARDDAALKAQQAMDMARKQLNELEAGTNFSEATVVALNKILGNAGIGAVNVPAIPARAQGGYTPAGLALVGEQGPEIVRFSRPAQVMTADETRDALRGGNNEAIVQAIAELKAEMRAVVVTQSNANPQIIEKLSGMEQRLSKMERTQRFTVGA